MFYLQADQNPACCLGLRHLNTFSIFTNKTPSVNPLSLKVSWNNFIASPVLNVIFLCLTYCLNCAQTGPIKLESGRYRGKQNMMSVTATHLVLREIPVIWFMVHGSDSTCTTDVSASHHNSWHCAKYKQRLPAHSFCRLKAGLSLFVSYDMGRSSSQLPSSVGDFKLNSLIIKRHKMKLGLQN
jgi:hypothetical protein